jgi:2-keto-3-deoxy-galactonokinase
LLIGAEIEEALGCVAGLAGEGEPEVAIIGGAELAASYATALQARGLRCAIRPRDVTARGLFHLARAAGLVR